MSQIEVNKVIPQSGTDVQLGESGDTITIPAGATITNNGTANGFGSADTEKVKVSSNDTTAGFLNGKLVAGTNISLTEGSDGGDETLTAAFTGTIGTSQIADSAVTTAKIASSAVDLTSKVTGALPVANGGTNLTSGFANGITEADQWRLTSNFSGTGDITSNLERADSTLQGNLGTGMTESSGIFTFPSTGYYHIIGTFELDASQNASYMSGEIYATSDNSNYSLTALARGGIAGNTGTDDRASVTCFSLLDITNVSLQKIKFRVDNSGGVAVGSSSYNRTHFTFIRLGDT